MTDGTAVHFTHQVRSVADLRALTAYCAQTSDTSRATYYQRLLATAHGRYDFSRASLNEAIEHSDLVDMQPLRMNQWLWNACQSI